MKSKKVKIRKISYDDFTFIIENVKNLKTIWLKHNSYKMQMYLFGGKMTYDEIEARIFTLKDSYIREYIEEVSKWIKK